MKTKLTIVSAIMLAVAATSCSQSDVEDGASSAIDPSQIAFRASVAKTRANDNSLDELKGGFNVIALDQSGAYISGFADPAGDNVTYFFNATAWDWKDQIAKAQKLWPMQDASYPLSFYAAYPLSTAVTKEASSVNANVISNLTPALFAYNTYYNGAPIAFDAAKVSVDELASLTQVTRRPVTGFADLTFKHIMANMKFNILVPANHEAYIQSIKIVNVNKSGRSYDYKTGAWSTETAYTPADNAHFAYFIASAGQPVQKITNAAGAVNGLADVVAGFNTPKLMPQKGVAEWDLDTFKTDAAAWSASLTDGVVDADAITKWHTQGTAAKGMLDSEGWKGARIEVIYCLVDKTAGTGKEKNVIGYKSGIDGATEDLMVRVGYKLDIAAINANAGWEAGKRYTFTIPLGTADASNGILLDPDFKTNTGENTTKPVKTSAAKPGEDITEGGIIQFNVDVTDWTDAPGVGVN